MKKQIRCGVFETNSSSTHAICISKDRIYGNLPEHVDFEHGEFGWECRKYDDVNSKASYLYQAICDMYEYDEKDEKLEHIKNVLNSHGIACIFNDSSAKVWDDGYIDHVGEDDMPDWLENMMSDDDALLTYLFGDAFVVTGNDNGEGFEDMMYEYLGEEKTPYGTFPEYGGYKKEYDHYDIYYKGN